MGCRCAAVGTVFGAGLADVGCDPVGGQSCRPKTSSSGRGAARNSSGRGRFRTLCRRVRGAMVDGSGAARTGRAGLVQASPVSGGTGVARGRRCKSPGWRVVRGGSSFGDGGVWSDRGCSPRRPHSVRRSAAPDLERACGGVSREDCRHRRGGSFPLWSSLPRSDGRGRTPVGTRPGWSASGAGNGPCPAAPPKAPKRRRRVETGHCRANLSACVCSRPTRRTFALGNAQVCCRADGLRR